MNTWTPPNGPGGEVILFSMFTLKELSRELRHRRHGRCGEWKFPTKVLVEEVRRRTGKEYV